MLDQKSNIYLSVSRGYDSASPDGPPHYRKPQHIWMLSVEPHKHHIPGIPDKHPQPVHIGATWDEDSNRYSLHSLAAGSDYGIVGNILISDSASVKVDEIQKLLERHLDSSASGSSTASNLPSKEFSSDESDHWIRLGLHVLQRNNTLEAFDVGEFMTFAHSFVAQRLDEDSDAPAMIAYPHLHADHEKKSKKRKFWISYPTSASTDSKNKNVKDKLYGGLM